MRIIKFRAWDKENKRMLSVEEIDFYLERINGVHGIYPITQSFKNIELMEFCGLKDKNGNEIFEGDIVNIEKGRNSRARKNKGPNIEKREVLWVLSAKQNGFNLCLNKVTEREVIGNIYENPELIK